MIIVRIKAGLGNQLFQYATARQLSIEMNTELYLDLSFYNKNKDRFFRLRAFNIMYEQANEGDIIALRNSRNPSLFQRILKKINVRCDYNKKSHWTEKQLMSFYNGDNCKQSVYLDGWFARPSFFEKIKPIIVEEMSLKNLTHNANTWYSSINSANAVAVHIRRGDYLALDYFAKVPISYYHTAIDYMISRVKNPIFYFFSDDLDFVEKHFKNVPGFRLVNTGKKIDGYVNNDRDVEDLYLMSKCKHQIIANSTFSWWGAWLNTNPDKIVIAPKKWFNNIKAQDQYEQGNLIPFGWIKI